MCAFFYDTERTRTLQSQTHTHILLCAGRNRAFTVCRRLVRCIFKEVDDDDDFHNGNGIVLASVVHCLPFVKSRHLVASFMGRLRLNNNDLKVTDGISTSPVPSFLENVGREPERKFSMIMAPVSCYTIVLHAGPNS